MSQFNEVTAGIPEKTAEKGRISDRIFYTAVGGGIGAAIALLFAPKSGSQLRSDISLAAQKGYEHTLDVAGSVRTTTGEWVRSVLPASPELPGDLPEPFSDMVAAGDDLAHKAERAANTASKTGRVSHPISGRHSSNIM